MSNNVVTDRLVTPPGSQATLENLNTVTRTSSWNGTLTHLVTVTWPSDNDARYFWNSGGNIQFTASRTGGNSGSKNNTWTTMFTTMGTITMTYSSTNASGSGNNSSYGWSNLPGSSTRIFDKPAPAGVYAENEYYIYARKINGSTLEFTIQFQDNDTGDQQGGYLPGPQVDEDIDGTLTSTVQARRASGSNVSVTLPSASGSGL